MIRTIFLLKIVLLRKVYNFNFKPLTQEKKEKKYFKEKECSMNITVYS